MSLNLIGWEAAEGVVRHRLDRRCKYIVLKGYLGGTLVSRAVKKTIGCPHCLGGGCKKCGGSGKRVVTMMDPSTNELVHYPYMRDREACLDLLSRALGGPKSRLECPAPWTSEVHVTGEDLKRCQLMVANGCMMSPIITGANAKYVVGTDVGETSGGRTFMATELGAAVLKSHLPYLPKWKVRVLGRGQDPYSLNRAEVDIEVYASTRAKAKAKAISPENLPSGDEFAFMTWKDAFMAAKSVRRIG